MKQDFTQEELTVIYNLLTQVQLIYKDSKIVNDIIDKVNSYIVRPKQEDVPIVTGEVIKPK